MSEPYKPCKYRGCTTAPRCDHSWWISATQNNDRERGPVANYVQLWPATRADRSVPKTKDQAADLQRYLATWLAEGRPASVPSAAPAAAPAADSAPAAAAANGRTISQALIDYRQHHVANMKCKTTPGILKRIETEYGTQPITVLFDRQLARDFVTVKAGKTMGASNRIQHQARWSHLLHWCQAEYKIAGESPFYSKLNPRGVKKPRAVKRDQRVPRTTEKKLLAAAAKLKDGGMMAGRLYCAIDAGLRRGEMLQLRSADIIQDYQGGKQLALRVRWEVSKTKLQRIVPVTTKRLRTFILARLKMEFTFGQADGTRLEDFREDWEGILLASGLEAGEWSTERRTKNGQRYSKWLRTTDANIHWHDLRHECGSRLAEAGVPLHELMVLMGHTDLKTTQRYLNATFSSLAAHMKAAHAGL